MNNQDSSKTFATGDNVVYGKFPEGAEASKDINIFSENNDNDRIDQEYYEDQFEYYDDDDEYIYYDTKEDDLKELKALLAADDNGTCETKMSFLQLLQNLQNQ